MSKTLVPRWLRCGGCSRQWPMRQAADDPFDLPVQDAKQRRGTSAAVPGKMEAVKSAPLAEGLDFVIPSLRAAVQSRPDRAGALDPVHIPDAASFTSPTSANIINGSAAQSHADSSAPANGTMSQLAPDAQEQVCGCREGRQAPPNLFNSFPATAVQVTTHREVCTQRPTAATKYKVSFAEQATAGAPAKCQAEVLASTSPCKAAHQLCSSGSLPASDITVSSVLCSSPKVTRPSSVGLFAAPNACRPAGGPRRRQPPPSALPALLLVPSCPRAWQLRCAI